MLNKKNTTRYKAELFTLALLAFCIYYSGAKRSGYQRFEEYNNEVAIAWNQVAVQIGFEHDQFLSFTGIRALTMSHIAMHDVLNAIDAKYEQYAFKEHESKANPLAAASQAAYVVLMTIYPEKKNVLDNELNKWLSGVDDGVSKEAGIMLGKKSASAILKLREGDGYEARGIYKPGTEPGDYQYTSEFNWVWFPDLDRTRPFALTSINQFRSPAPPELSGIAYAQSYNEVKMYGVKNSKVRSEDQTNSAHWWAEFAEHSWNRIGRITAMEQNLSLWETARMFALINMSTYDTYLAVFDSKYNYDTWRPITAIREGAKDGNQTTEQDSDWEPEMLNPPFPEYPSGHSAVGAGGAEIVAHIYGTSQVPFSMESVTALPDGKIRSYSNLDSAANACAESRIMNGFHFRFSTEEGKRLGRKVAKHIYGNYLRPLEKAVTR